MGELLKWLVSRLANNRGEVTTGAAPDPQLQARLEALEKSNAQLAYKLRAWEKLDKENGDLFQKDSQGNPIGFNIQDDNSSSGGFGDPDFSPYDKRYVSQEQYQKDLARVYQQAMSDAIGNIHLFRSLDKTLGDPTFKDLGKYDSDWAKRTAAIMQEKGWGRPLDGANSWDKWQYKDPDSFRTAAEIAQAKLFQEQQAKTAADQQAKDAQKSASLISGTNGAGSTAPDPEAWKKAIDAGGDALEKMMKQDAAANLSQMTGQPITV